MNRLSFSNILAALVILALAAFVLFPIFAHAADTPLIAPSSAWYEVWIIVQPVVVLLVTTVGPVLVTWISARLIALLKVSDEAKRVEIEAGMRAALHQSAGNALKFALAKSGLSAGAVTIGGAVVNEAVRYVESKNPDAVKKLGVSPDALRDIVMSKVPDLIKR